MYLVICEDCKHTRFRFTCIMTMFLAALFFSLLLFYTAYLYGGVYIRYYVHSKIGSISLRHFE